MIKANSYCRAAPRWGALLLAAMALLVACDRGGRLTQTLPSSPTSPVLTATPGGTPTGEPAIVVPSPQPTATHDLSRPAWTILYYANADGDRAADIWDDLNELEAAGAGEAVRVVAQVDWPEGGPAGTAEGVRYLVRPDEDRAQLASEIVATLGETNQGDPAALADFLVWGMTTYPANRYALFLGDHGGGWAGCCLDTTAGASGQSDHLSLADLDQALAAATAGGARLEVIAFAASLMSQLDVLQTVQPYVTFAVASPGLVPGSAWDYQTVLAQLNAEPLIDSRQFAADLVIAFVNAQRQLNGDEFVSMTAVDLARVPALTGAVEMLAAALAVDPALGSAIATDARRGAQRYGEATLEAERLAAVDLLHAAAIMAEVAPDGDLRNAAVETGTAVVDALVADERGAGVPAGRGIALYWPAGAPAPLYTQAGRLPGWAGWLSAAAGSAPPASLLTLDGGAREMVHMAQPALMRAELIAHGAGEVAVVADQELADGRRILRQYESIQPPLWALPGGVSASLWRDGRHESFLIWDATGGYLSDAAGAGDYAPLRPVDPSPAGAQLAVAGHFRRAESEASRPATVVFGPGSAASTHLWAVTTVGDGLLVGEPRPGSGDVFQPSALIVGADGTLTAEPGAPLVYDEAPAIYRGVRPLPAGRYTVGLRVAPPIGPPVVAARSLTVDPAGPPPGFRAFVDAVNNAQFVYPTDWPSPTPGDGVTIANSPDNMTQLQVRYYPNWTGDLAALHAEALGTFGSVSILLQEPARVGGESDVEAIRTAYGYDSAEAGARTGAFLTFLRDGVGYVVDIDGPREVEATTLAMVDTIAATWQFLPPRLGFGPEPLAMLNVAGFQIAYPAGYAYQEFNGWHRFTADPQTFVAVRIQPAGRAPAEVMSGLLLTAVEGVSGFTADEPRRFFYAGRVWERNDFTYTDEAGGVVRGLLLSRVDGDAEIAVWAEAPDGGDLVERVFLPVAASIERIPAPPSG